eukprot:scaffold74226_cov51-Attheya_sp.AAC.8
MVLYIIGLGLGDEKDITLRGLEAIQSSDQVFLEAYTSVLRVDKSRLEALYKKDITIADRNFVECEAEQIYRPAQGDGAVSLLVVGDPVCATTHTDLILRAREEGIRVELIHNASIMGAAGCCGLQTVSIPYFSENWRPTSFYSKIHYNRMGGMHTLCLLDIKVKEPDFEAMAKGRTVFLPPRYMSVNVAAEQLIEAVEMEEAKKAKKKKNSSNSMSIMPAYDAQSTLCVGLARLGQPDQIIIAGTLEELTTQDFGEPLHSFIVCGDTHELELEVLKEYLVPGSKYKIDEHATALTEEDQSDDDDDDENSAEDVAAATS